MKDKIARTHNRRLAKKRVQWLIEALCFVSSSVLAESLVLRNPLLRQARKRFGMYQVICNFSDGINVTKPFIKS